MEDSGKRVSFVELYLDLVFVIAVGQLAHLIVAEPRMHSVWVALGLFFTLWWTWIGFAVLYNRYGEEEGPLRLLFLAASVPVGVAAVAIEPASSGDVTVFALAMAVTRLILVLANGLDGGFREVLRARLAVHYVVSAALFVISIWVPEPYRYAAWAVAIASESGGLLREDKQALQRARREHDWKALTPTDPAERLDAHHFAERFGLFLIILLGEVLVQAATTSVNRHVETVDGWGALVAAMILAAALWWLYFDAAAEINLRILELSGGSPTLARGLFAIGHMLPSFALLVIAAGVGLLLGPDPERIAYWLPCLGLAIYLLGTRVFMVAHSRAGAAARAVLLLATFQLGRLHAVLGAHAYLWLLCAWAVMCAVIANRTPDRDDTPDSEPSDPEALRSPPPVTPR